MSVFARIKGFVYSEIIIFFLPPAVVCTHACMHVMGEGGGGGGDKVHAMQQQQQKRK